MNLNFIGVNEKILNLDSIALIEDLSEDGRSVALLTTNAGAELRLIDEDAEAIFARCELMIQATNAVLGKMQQATVEVAK